MLFDIIIILISSFLIGLASYELFTGKAFTRRGVVTKGQNPYGFYITVISNYVVGIVFLLALVW